jgi:hypothetical protein
MVWTGSQEDLRRVATLFTSLGEERRVALVEELRAKSAKEREEGSQDEWSLKYADQQLLRETERIDDYYQLTVTGEDGDDTTKGDFETVLNEIDRRSVSSIKFEIGRYDDKIVLTFKRSGYEAGAKLAVSSPDLGWGKRSYVELTDEVAKGVPRYSWIHTTPGRGITGLASSLLIVLTVVLLVLPAVTSKDRPGVWIIGAFSTLWVFMGLTITGRIFEWLAPHFELIGADVQPTGSRRIWAIIGLIGAVIIGIIVNRIYS